MEYKTHPASALFPMLSDSELQQLAEDIKANGLLEPVVLYHGEILDGRNRFAACKLADVEPRFAEVHGEIASPTIYVISKNLHRRHLTQSQRAAVAAEAIPALQQEAKARQLSGLKNQPHTSLLPIGSNEKGRTVAIAAKAAQVGERSVARVLQVKRDNPDAFEKVKSGELTAWEASQEKHSGTRTSQKHGGQQPKDLHTERGKQRAEAHKRRLVNGLSMLNGLCSGLHTLQLELIAALCEPDELEMWASKTEKNSRELRQFAAELRKCGKPSGTNGKAQSRQFGDSSDSATQSAASVVEEAN